MDREFKIIESSSEPCCKNVLWLTNEGFKKYINDKWQLYNPGNVTNNNTTSNYSNLVTLHWNGAEGLGLQILDGEIKEGDELILSRYVNVTKGRSGRQGGAIKRFTTVKSRKESERKYKSIPFTKNKEFLDVDSNIIKDFFLEETNIYEKAKKFVLFKGHLNNNDITKNYSHLSMYSIDDNFVDGDNIDRSYDICCNFWRYYRRKRKHPVFSVNIKSDYIPDAAYPYQHFNFRIKPEYNGKQVGEIYYLALYRNGKRISNYIPFNIYIGRPKASAYFYDGGESFNIYFIVAYDNPDYILIEVDYSGGTFFAELLDYVNIDRL